MKKFVKPKVASEFTGFAEQTLANMRYQGRGPKYYVLENGDIRYELDELGQWMTLNPVDPQAAA